MLIPFDLDNEEHLWLTYRLLKERFAAGNVNIPGCNPSKCPTFEGHCLHLRNRKREYRFFYLWRHGLIRRRLVASVFLRQTHSSQPHEIGVFVLKDYQRRGIAAAAVRAMLKRHPVERVIARIHPDNYASAELFAGLGFRRVCNVWSMTER